MIREHLMQRRHVEKSGFRWRGAEITRLEALSDAVFGFAITLLVVSLEVPDTFTGLLGLMRGLPATAISRRDAEARRERRSLSPCLRASA